MGIRYVLLAGLAAGLVAGIAAAGEPGGKADEAASLEAKLLGPVDGKVSPFLAPLQGHQKAVQARLGEMVKLGMESGITKALGSVGGAAAGVGPGGAPDAAKEREKAEERRRLAEKMKPAAAGLLADGEAFAKTLEEFRTATTRRGLDTEFDAIDTCVSILKVGAAMTAALADPTPEDKQKAAALERRTVFERLLQTEIDPTIQEIAAARIAERLNTDGLEEVLLAESWRDVRQRVEARVIQEVRQFINKESQSIAGFPAADVDSFRQAARLAVQNRVRQEVAKLVVNFTGSGLVIQFAQEVVIEWLGDTLWPKLREAFRPKGNIEGRLTQSLATLEASRRELNALGSGAGGAAKVELREVQATVDRAWVRLAATRYLERDIKKSGGDEPYGRLLDAKLGLLRTIDLAEHRFMLAKAARIAALASQSRLLDESLKTLRASVPKLGT
jgi:hypothetical protein